MTENIWVLFLFKCEAAAQRRVRLHCTEAEPHIGSSNIVVCNCFLPPFPPLSVHSGPPQAVFH